MTKFLLILFACLLPLRSPAQTNTSADSLAQTETGITYRYANATSLTLRAHPDAAATANALIAGASRVQFVQ